MSRFHKISSSLKCSLIGNIENALCKNLSEAWLNSREIGSLSDAHNVELAGNNLCYVSASRQLVSSSRTWFTFHISPGRLTFHWTLREWLEFKLEHRRLPRNNFQIHTCIRKHTLTYIHTYTRDLKDRPSCPNTQISQQSFIFLVLLYDCLRRETQERVKYISTL